MTTLDNPGRQGPQESHVVTEETLEPVCSRFRGQVHELDARGIAGEG